MTSKFFYTKDMGSMFDESNYSLMSCDLDDMEAVSASRLLYSLLQGFTHDSGNSKKSCVDSHDLADFGGREHVAAKPIHCVLDVDLQASDFKALVEEGKVSALLVLLTKNSMHSASQLLRLGFVHKYAPDTSPYTLIPLAISDVFAFPGIKLLDDIEKGRGLILGSSAEDFHGSGHFQAIKEMAL